MNLIEENLTFLASGLVLAVNCVPQNVDPNIGIFWGHLNEALKDRGFELVVATTAPLEVPGLAVISIPFNLYEYLTPDQGDSTFGRTSLDHAKAWYAMRESSAKNHLHGAYTYLGQLLDALRPSAVIAWQRTHPVSRALISEAQDRSLPTWCAERGWLRDTLMFDLGYNNFLSEIQTSIATQRQLSRYAYDEGLQKKLTQRFESHPQSGRYESKDFIGESELRDRYNIDPDSPLVVFFNHGEPHLYPGEKDALGALHGLTHEALNKRIEQAAQYCANHDLTLLIQEHPFNHLFNREVEVPPLNNVIQVQENPITLIHAAHRLLFTISTLQFDALLSNRPFGLLGRSILSQQQGAYEWDQYPDIDSFMEDLMRGQDWPHRHRQLCRTAQFLYENFLYDIDPESCQKSALEFATHLSRFSRPTDDQFPVRVDQFLATWSA